eukprot:9487295-Pyramimonas_sp.AAC.1
MHKPDFLRLFGLQISEDALIAAMGAVKATVEGDGSAGGRPVKFHVFTQGSPGDYWGSPRHATIACRTHRTRVLIVYSLSPSAIGARYGHILFPLL